MKNHWALAPETDQQIEYNFRYFEKPSGAAGAAPAILPVRILNLRMLKKKIWWSFIQQQKWQCTGIIALGLLTSYFTLLLPLSIGKYLEIVFSAGGGKTKALQLLGINLPDRLSVFFIFFSCIVILKFFTGWMHQYYASLMGELFIHQLRQKLFIKHLGQKENNKFSASVLLPYTSEAKALQRLLVKGVLGLLKDLLYFSMALYVLFLINKTLTVTVLLAIGVFFLTYRWYGRKQKNVFADKRKKQGALLNHISRSLLAKNKPGMPPLPLFDKKAGQLQQSGKASHLRRSFLQVLPPFMLYSMLAVIMALIVWGIGSENLLSGDVITYILLLMTLFPVIRSIIKIEYIWLQGKLSAGKFERSKDETPGKVQPAVKEAELVPD